MSKSANKILHTAQVLFNTYSFGSVGVDLIRDTSGCSKTTMYTYFKNKNQLVEQVLKQRDEMFRTQLSSVIVGLEGKEAIKAILKWHLNWFQTNDFKGCLFVRAVSESNSEQINIKEIARFHKQWLRDLMISLLPEDGELIYCVLEGLISRFLVEGYSAQVADRVLKKALN